MKLIAPIEKDEDIVNKQYVDNKVSTKVENTETGISTALDKISNNTANATDTDVYITKVNNKYYKRSLSYLWNWIKTKVEALGYTKNTGTLTGIKMNGVSKGTSGVVDLGKVLTGGSQTTTATEDGGNNIYTFSDNSTITVRNGTKGSKGDIGPQGPRGEKGDTGTAATISVGTVTTGAAGTNAVVTNAGTSSAAKFNFTIPRGVNGTNGTSATWFTGTAVTGTSTTAVTVSVTGSKAGDMYLNTSTYNVYSATAANSWVYKCNIKGATGSAGSSGTSAGFGTPTATVDANTGTPSVTITATGPNTAKVFNFAFKNLKGERGSDANITWGNTYITNADEAPLGFSKISNQGINNPFMFWVTLLTTGESETSGYKQQWAFPWGNAEAITQAPKYRVKDNGNWGEWTSLKNGGNANNANTVGGIAVTKLKGNDTKFIYTSQNGIGEHNLTEFKEEGHYFVFNYNDSPTNYGFLDISVFDGNGFTPMPNGIIRQLWTDYKDPSKYYMRIYNSTSDTDGTWTNWTKISDNGSAKAPSSPQTSIDWDNISFEERSKYIDVKNLAFWNGAYSDNGNSNITRVNGGSPLIGITASGTNLRFTTADGSISSKTVNNIGIISGSALGSSGTTATTDAGKTYGIAAVTTSPYTYTKWISNLDCGLKNLYNGMIIKIIVPVAGNTRGTCLSIDGGNTYHPVVYNTNSLISTHFGVGTALLLMYDNNISASVYNNSTTATAIKGVWRVLNNFDTDNDTKVTNTLNTTTKAYITGTTSDKTNTGTQIFDTGVYLDTTAGMLTANTFKGIHNYEGNNGAWAFNITRTDFTKGDTPTYNTYWSLNFMDKNGGSVHTNRIGYLSSYVDTSGNSYIGLCAMQNALDSTNNASIFVGKKNDNTEYLRLGSSTIGSSDTPVYMNGGFIMSTGKKFSDYLPLSGGTISGNVTFNNEISNIVLGQHTAAGPGDVPYGYINLYNRGSIAGDIYGSNDGGLIVRSMTNNTGSIGDSSHYFDSAYINNLDKVTMIKGSGDTYHIAERTDLTFTDSKGNKQHEDIRFGISAGNNRGIWDRRLLKWLIRADTSGNVYFGDPSYADKTTIRGQAIQKIGNINRTSYSGSSTKWIMVSINSRKHALLVFHFSTGTEHYLLNYTITNTNGTINETQILAIKGVAIFIKLTDGKIGWYIPNLITGATCTLDVYAYD